jgi:hypothetical protein
MRTNEAEVAEIMARPWTYPGLPVRDAASLLLLFSSNFSLGVWSCWSIFRQDNRFYVRRIEWARGSDRVRVGLEAPTTFGTESPISAEEANRLATEAEELISREVPAQSKEIRLDGVSRHLLLPARRSGAARVFWFAGSAETMRLDAWVEESSVTLDNLLTQSTAHRGTSAA